MRICIPRAAIELFLVSALLLALTACGTKGMSNLQNSCGGCAFIYATTNSDQILTMSIQSDGTLSAAGSSAGPANGPDILGTGFMPQPPFGGPLYVSDPTQNALDAFVVDSSNGTFTMMAGSPFALNGPAGTPAGLLTFGNYLYAGDTNGTVSGFNIEASGSLTALSGSPFAAGSAPLQLISAYTGSPSIGLLYAADFTGGGIWAFTIGSDGVLSPVSGSPFATPANSAPAGMFAGGNAVTGSILYVALSGLNQIAAFSISSTGALTPIPGSPFPAGGGPKSLLGFSTFLYAMNTQDHSVTAYSVDQNSGMLTQIQGSPFAAGTATGNFVVNPHVSSIFYVPDLQSSSVIGFTADNASGSLTTLSGSPFPTTASPLALTSIAFPVLDPP